MSDHAFEYILCNVFLLSVGGLIASVLDDKFRRARFFLVVVLIVGVGLHHTYSKDPRYARNFSGHIRNAEDVRLDIVNTEVRLVRLKAEFDKLNSAAALK